MVDEEVLVLRRGSLVFEEILWGGDTGDARINFVPGVECWWCGVKVQMQKAGSFSGLARWGDR